MARGKNQKLKLLYLAKIMQEETDDMHRLTMPQLIWYRVPSLLQRKRVSSSSRS